MCYLLLFFNSKTCRVRVFKHQTRRPAHHRHPGRGRLRAGRARATRQRRLQDLRPQVPPQEPHRRDAAAGPRLLGEAHHDDRAQPLRVPVCCAERLRTLFEVEYCVEIT